MSRRSTGDVAERRRDRRPQGVHSKGGAAKLHHPGELRLAEVASDPVIELDPVEESELKSPPESSNPHNPRPGSRPARCADAEAPRSVAELDSDAEIDTNTDVDDRQAISPPARRALHKKNLRARRRANRTFLLGGLALGMVVLATVVTGFVLSRGRVDPSYQALVARVRVS